MAVQTTYEVWMPEVEVSVTLEDLMDGLQRVLIPQGLWVKEVGE